MEERSGEPMAEICPVCGLPKELCVCGEIAREQQRIRIRVERRKWSKEMTIIEGIEPTDTPLSRIAQRLKAYCACGGTAKNNVIMLQGDQREKAKEFLVKELGYPEENIEIQ